MADTWTSIAARDVTPGATIRLPNGDELEVSRIEDDFMGMPGLRAFVEDTPRRWFKAPLPADLEVEVRAAG
jgi:hypothetical protein